MGLRFSIYMGIIWIYIIVYDHVSNFSLFLN
jgi:hypothetical protein